MKRVIEAKPAKPTHYAFRFDDPRDNDYSEEEAKKEAEKAPKAKAETRSDEVDAILHEGEYVLSEGTVEALGEEWLDYVQENLKQEGANALWVLIGAMELLPEDRTKLPRNGADKPARQATPEMVREYGEEFLNVLEEYLRLHPGKPRRAINASVEKVGDKQFLRRGGKIKNDKPIIY